MAKPPLTRLTLPTLVLITFLATRAAAQSPQLLVRGGDKPHPIALAKAEIHAVIAGQLSRTTMTLTFHNDADRLLEGELVFPLPDNATISGYALDVAGQMADAVVVEKEKARVTFETEVRRGIDPALIEKVQGNNFRSRIYPIPAKGTRTIRVEYVSDLVPGDGSALFYLLPLKWDKSVAQMSIRLDVLKSESPVVPRTSAENGGKLEDLAFVKWEDRFVAQQSLQNVQLNTVLKVALPQFPSNHVMVEKRITATVSPENLDPKVAQQFTRLQYYFLASAQPPERNADMPRPAKPARLAVEWDASLSRAGVDHARELLLLDSHLKALGDVRVEVVLFRNLPEPAKTFIIKSGDTAELLSFLRAVVYDGGTNLAALEFDSATTQEKRTPADKTAPPIAYHLLFTDGLANLGESLPPDGAVKTPIYAIAADPRSNHAILRRLCSTSGGSYLDLTRLTDAQGLGVLGKNNFSLISIDADPGQAAEIYPRLPQQVAGRIAIAGRLTTGQESATITLNYGFGSTITHRQRVTIRKSEAADSGLIARFWAQLKIADLSAAEEANEQAIVRLGKEFNLVTSFTSMLVLETAEQYVRYKIVPPKSRPEIYAAFMKGIEQQEKVAADAEKAKIDKVLAMWNARLAWWNKDFSYPADFKYKEPVALKQQIGGATGSSSTAGSGPHPSTPATAFDAAAHPNRPAESPHPAQAPANGRERRAMAAESLDESGSGRKESLENKTRAGQSPTITLKEWSPDTPYLRAMSAAKTTADAYAIYTDQRGALKNSPAFYLDCADFFAKRGDKELAIRVLTNIPELGLDDGRLLRIAAHRLQQLWQLDLAIDLFTKVVRLRPEEPQSFRDLALALADRASADGAGGDGQQTDRARSDYERALVLLNKVVMTPWQRFDEIEVIALMEAGRILTRAAELPANPGGKIRNPFDPRLASALKNLELGVRIVLTWDTDNTDVDLHVWEPSGEHCNYSHNRTTIGGLVSRDFTQGYGPEEYCLKKLMPGTYTIKAHFYGNRDQKLVGPTTVQATIFTNWGKPDEKRQSLTLRLAEAKEMVEIGSVSLQP